MRFSQVNRDSVYNTIRSDLGRLSALMESAADRHDDLHLSQRSEDILQALTASHKPPFDKPDLFEELDGPSFDCTAYINRLLPNPESLTQLPHHIKEIDSQCQTLDEQIRR
jgi:hypothetical protein